MNRKQELLTFLDYVLKDQLVGVYYLDKMMGIVHYSIYSDDSINVLKEKLSALPETLEDDMLKILLWKTGESEEYLIGVYEGIVMAEKETNQ